MFGGGVLYPTSAPASLDTYLRQPYCKVGIGHEGQCRKELLSLCSVAIPASRMCVFRRISKLVAVLEVTKLKAPFRHAHNLLSYRAASLGVTVGTCLSC